MITGAREKDKTPSVFTHIHLHYILSGDLDEKKVGRALHLAVDVYCSAGEMLGKTAKITHDFEINGVT